MDNAVLKEPILEVSHLIKNFGKKHSISRAVDDVSFSIGKGEVFGLVGESGSGKTTIGRTVIKIYEPDAGKIIFKGRDISGRLKGEDKLKLAREMQMIFQDPMSSLNPSKKVFDIIAKGLDVHKLCSSEKERADRVYEIMEEVGLSREYAGRYPSQFSGGQRQRIAIARALVTRPDLIIADEPISALDVSIQSQIVNLLRDLQKKYGTTILFIAHDLAMVKYLSDRIGVMHLGHIVETGTTEDVFSYPVHPYTRSLLSAIPKPDPGYAENNTRIVYDCEKSGIDYNAGSMHRVSGSHYVLCTDEELELYTSSPSI